MEYEIKRFNLWSAAKMIFIIFLVIGIFLSLFYIVIIGILGNFIQSIGIDEFEQEMLSFSGIGGFFIVLFMSIFYAVILTIFSVFILVLYNIAAGLTGGIKFNTDSESSKKSDAVIQTEPS